MMTTGSRNKVFSTLVLKLERRLSLDSCIGQHVHQQDESDGRCNCPMLHRLNICGFPCPMQSKSFTTTICHESQIPG